MTLSCKNIKHLYLSLQSLSWTSHIISLFLSFCISLLVSPSVCSQSFSFTLDVCVTVFLHLLFLSFFCLSIFSVLPSFFCFFAAFEKGAKYIVLELQWFQEQQDLCFTPTPMDASPLLAIKSPPPRDMPPSTDVLPRMKSHPLWKVPPPIMCHPPLLVVVCGDGWRQRSALAVGAKSLFFVSPLSVPCTLSGSVGCLSVAGGKRQVDDIHLVLEYRKGQQWGDTVTPRAGRSVRRCVARTDCACACRLVQRSAFPVF